MEKKNGRVIFNEVEMITDLYGIVNVSKFPRTAVIPIARDKDTGYVNAGPYSGGVVSVDPYMLVFGAKSWDGKLLYEETDEFVIGLPSKDQVQDMWVMALSVPHGISEIDVAGCTELPMGIDAPGVKEFPINLKCKMRKLIKLGKAMRNIVVCEVIGISMSKELIDMGRAEAAHTVPIHEAVLFHPYTNTYTPGHLGKELRGVLREPQKHDFKPDENGKVYIDKSQFYQVPYNDIFVKAVVPQPNYGFITLNEDGSPHITAITGGLLMHCPPAVHIPLKKDSVAYKNLKRHGYFTVAYPVRSIEKEFLALRKSDGTFKGSGFTPDYSGGSDVPGIKECPANMECRVFVLEDIPDSDYAVVIADKIGVYADEKMQEFVKNRFMDYYPELIYTVYDYGMNEVFGIMNEFKPVLPHPSYGSRHNDAWATGPEQYQSGFFFWLMDLMMMGYLTEIEYGHIRKWTTFFRNQGRYSPEPLRTQMRERLTKVIRMMSHAHRDFDKWHEVHEYLNEIIQKEPKPLYQ